MNLFQSLKRNVLIRAMSFLGFGGMVSFCVSSCDALFPTKYGAEMPPRDPIYEDINDAHQAAAPTPVHNLKNEKPDSANNTDPSATTDTPLNPKEEMKPSDVQAENTPADKNVDPSPTNEESSPDHHPSAEVPTPTKPSVPPTRYGIIKPGDKSITEIFKDNNEIIK